MSGHRILLSLVPDDREDLDHARRRIAYDRLILATGPERRPLAEAVAQEENSTAQGATEVARILDIPPHDPIGVHLAITQEVRRARPGTVILNAGGGNTAQLVALIMVAYHEGLETVFAQHGRIGHLPILRGTTLPAWFPQEEADMMHALATDDDVATLDARLGRGRAPTQRTFRSLVNKGLVAITVRSGHAHGTLTATGTLVLSHMPRPRNE